MSEKKYMDLKTFLENQQKEKHTKEQTYFHTEKLPNHPLKTAKKLPLSSEMHERWLRWVKNIDH